MSRPRYIVHRTLSTGDQRDSHADEVPDDVRLVLRPLLDRAANGERVAVPGVDTGANPFTLTAEQGRDRALLVTVWGPDGDSRLGVLGTIENRVPIALFGIAPRSLAGAALWRIMSEGDIRLQPWPGREPFQGDGSRPPPAPWCCVCLLAGIALYPDAAKWLGDFERCCAWAWIE